MTNLINQIKQMNAEGLSNKVKTSNEEVQMPVFKQRELEPTGIEFELYGTAANDNQRESGVIANMVASTMFFKYHFALMWSSKKNSMYIAGEDNISFALKMEILEECKNFVE